MIEHLQPSKHPSLRDTGPGPNLERVFALHSWNRTSLISSVAVAVH